jgi:hypothetical protein
MTTPQLPMMMRKSLLQRESNRYFTIFSYNFQEEESPGGNQNAPGEDVKMAAE